MREMIQRMSDYITHKYSIGVGYVASVGLVGDGAAKKTVQAESAGAIGLADWQIILGLVWLIIQIVPKLYHFVLWLRRKCNGRHKDAQDEESQ